MNKDVIMKQCRKIRSMKQNELENQTIVKQSKQATAAEERVKSHEESCVKEGPNRRNSIRTTRRRPRDTETAVLTKQTGLMREKGVEIEVNVCGNHKALSIKALLDTGTPLTLISKHLAEK